MLRLAIAQRIGLPLYAVDRLPAWEAREWSELFELEEQERQRAEAEAAAKAKAKR